MAWCFPCFSLLLPFSYAYNLPTFLKLTTSYLLPTEGKTFPCLLSHERLNQRHSFYKWGLPFSRRDLALPLKCVWLSAIIHATTYALLLPACRSVCVLSIFATKLTTQEEGCGKDTISFDSLYSMAHCQHTCTLALSPSDHTALTLLSCCAMPVNFYLPASFSPGSGKHTFLTPSLNDTGRGV